jgi:carbon-monoxide dehydrogenase large subunit
MAGGLIGQRVRRREDPRFLLGQGRYVDDIRLEGELHVAFVRSPWAHARVLNVDVSAARERSGVLAFTASDVGLGRMPLPPFMEMNEGFHRPFLASDRVRFAGDVVAVVLAESRGAAVDAAELVDVDYEPLPVVTDVRDAVNDEVVLFEEVGSNLCMHVPPEQTDPHLFDDCEVVIEDSLFSQRLAACPIEARASLAHVGEGGRLTVWLSTQTPHQDRDGIAALLGLEASSVRVMAPDVGGGFGGKGLDVEDVLVSWLARETGRPVRWTETRSENLVAMHHGRAQRTAFRLGGGRDGTIKALRLDILQDAGAYPGIGAFLPRLTALMSSGVYRIPKIEIDIKAVVTNGTPVAAVRGAGRPEATQILERALDIFAAELSLDPAEVRRRNFIDAGAFPFTTASGATYDCGDYAGALERALEHADYEQLRAEQESKRQAREGSQLGIGLSVYVEVTNGLPEAEYGAVEITSAGDAIVRTGSFSHGQGHETTFAQIVAERLGLPIERVTVVKGDTDEVSSGTGTYGSKSTQIGGAAAMKASEELVERGKQIAAEHLEASPADMRLDIERGRFHVAGSPEPALSWADLAAALDDGGRLAELAAETTFDPGQPTFPFGAHLAVVEVDTETGAVALRQIVAVDDAGRIINPLVADGQVHGGLAAGIAQALYEELTYDEDGNPLNSTLVSYGIPGATELPTFDRVEMETPTPVNPLGAKGIGESATIGSTAAVLNAVVDALAPYGVRNIDMPANGERVWRAIQSAGDGRGQP